MTMDLTPRLAPGPGSTISPLGAADTRRSGFERLPSGRVCGPLTFSQYGRLSCVPHSREDSIVSGCTMEFLLGRTSLSRQAGRTSYSRRITMERFQYDRKRVA